MPTLEYLKSPGACILIYTYYNIQQQEMFGVQVIFFEKISTA